MVIAEREPKVIWQYSPSRGKARGQGPLEAERFFAFAQPEELASLS